MTKYIPFFVLFLALLYACSDDSGSNSLEPTFTDVYEEILSVRCAKSGCHLDSRTPAMTSAQATYDNLVGRASSHGLNYIQPGSPDSSYLYLKIIPDDIGRQGTARMPRDGENTGYLSTSQIETIRDWILDGAENN